MLVSMEFLVLVWTQSDRIEQKSRVRRVVEEENVGQPLCTHWIIRLVSR